MRFALLLSIAAALAASASAQGTIRGSKHDFASAAWNTGAGSKQNEICGVCHLPHVMNRPTDRRDQTLLWGRQMSTTVYAMYAGYALQGVTDAQPTGTSRLCLSCHDGSVALELFHTRTAGSTSLQGSTAQVPGKNNGQDFGADHPISITYNAGTGPGQDKYLRLPTTPFGGTVPNQTIADILEGGKVQCKSCHDVHAVDVPVGSAKLLRIQNNNPATPSALCLACHIK